MNHIWFYLTSAILSFCVIVATVRVGNWSVKSLAGPLPPVPPLNVYLDLVFSGKRFAELKEISNLESNEVVQIVEKFRPDLLRARTLADDPAMVALDTKRGWAEAHEEDQKALKRLAVVLILDGKAALNDHRPMDAVASALAAVKVGHSAIRGGTRVDGLTGLIIQAIAVADIQAMIPKLDPAELRMIIKTLQELDGQDESAEQILARDHLWERKTYGLMSLVGDLTMRAANRKRSSDFSARYAQQLTRNRQAILRAAAQCYKLENGKPPDRALDLAPKYVRALPVDPLTGKTMEIPKQPFL